jgi:predicted amidohydrolase
MPTWTVAAVQSDVRLGDRDANLAALLRRLHAAADRGARLIVFPECTLSGYGLVGRQRVDAHAEPVPGPATAAVAAVSRERGVFAAFGLLEKAGAKVFNACALVGPGGHVATYRKTHLPCLGLDRFTDPGDMPFAVHDLGGLRVGMAICFDGGFPEVARALTLLGADLILLPTNWPEQAMKSATLVSRVRALENHVYFLSVNRVGTEAGTRFIGYSSIVGCTGDFLAVAEHDREETILAEIDPEVARRKKIVYRSGEYEIDRVNWRRPEFYGVLAEPRGAHPAGPHASR